MAVAQKGPTLDLSITINDGFFVLGSRYYTFPIVTAVDAKSPSPGGSPPPTAAMEETEEDGEFEELKGMYIDLKKKIVLSQYQSTEDLYSRNKQKVVTEQTAIRYNCQRDSNNTGICILKEKAISKLPPQIEKECSKDGCPENDQFISFEYFDDETLEVFSNALIVVIDTWLEEYTKGKTIKVVGVGLSTCILGISDFSDRIKRMLWEKYDILPCFYSGEGKPLDQQSEQLARKCASLFGQENLPRLSIIENNRVNIDSGNIWYCSIEDYRGVMGKKSDQAMKELLEIAHTMKDQKIAFFSSTPQGGGVALMRHSLMRFFQMLGISAAWYVCIPSPSVFNITKKKIHNILQNVAPPEIDLTKEDKTTVDRWLKNNYEVNWKSIIKGHSVVVLDDHQVARLGLLIKEDYPEIKIVYRSHIQIRSEVLDQNKALKNVWEYLYEGIEKADLFISHPIESAVPEEVPRKKVLFQPAGTDPLDGLNKKLNDKTMLYYQNVFNRICIDNREPPVNFSKKYIVQIARFDPSKGIPDLLEAYYKLYMKFCEKNPADKFSVGLVICGHGSVDDPESTIIFNQISQIIESESFQAVKHLITKIRLPPSDQLLNVILQGAHICCQLSLCEGYEVKVSESLMKRVPVIVYNTGGLPLQVHHNINGYIIEKNNTQKVSEHMYELLFNPETYKTIKEGIDQTDTIGITTPYQALFWLYTLKLLKEGAPGNERKIFKELNEKYLK
ncbi:alpha,alpha-trehalose phosphorylase (configuration-retaining) [Nematocida sp. AWRm80]|nr:alpha,alpha-trehalose phosphorylase (configuration-retaining) [Nematocida sp. AWRm80]